MAFFQNSLKSFNIAIFIIFVLFHQNVFGQTKASSTSLSIQTSMSEISRVAEGFAPNGTISQTIEQMKYTNLESALENCREFLDLALYNLNQSLAISSDMTTSEIILENVRTWVSAAGADLETCIDGFEYAPYEANKVVTDNLNNSTKLINNYLAILYKINDDGMHQHAPKSFNTESRSDHESSMKVTSDWPPNWLSSDDRTLLLGDSKELITQANVVVAADGSGNYKTISAAINAVPSYSNTRFAIYVKKGVYFENVYIDRAKWNVVMIGDGMDNTIVSANRNNASGYSTKDSATFSVMGNGFIARDMGFVNTAGPSKAQAVAALVGSDQSVFYRCRFDGYQDTLLAHSMRQFYRECKISGTIDFIFGYAFAVFQICSILVKRPLPGQFNAITANGKWSQAAQSGFTLQNCPVSSAEDLSGVQTYLGRPWKSFSTTVYMESTLGSLIDPKGWHPWIPNVTPPDTIYCIEFNNKGPGAVTSNRVKWKGLRLNVSPAEANKFTVRSLIQGDKWIPATGVPFQPDL